MTVALKLKLWRKNWKHNKEEILVFDGENTRMNALAGMHTKAQQNGIHLRTNEFHAVLCADCGTHIAVLDSVHQYHFFNTIPSTG